MIGSLVAVFPTPHEGGALILRHDNKEWTFDSNILLQGAKSPSVAYVAFFSDVEHEVMTVTSGHRVTLTWNLYLVDKKAPTPAKSLASPEDELANFISLALNNSSVLAEGGTIGFGLSFQYSISSDPDHPTDIKTIEKGLKGCDAYIFRTLTKAGLVPSLQCLYKVRYNLGRLHMPGDREETDAERGEGPE
jgi:hypothetical protein